MLTSIDKLSPDAIIHFRKTGESDVIPVHAQRMIIQLDRAINLLRVKFSVSRAAAELMKEFPELSYSVAKERVADAVNYFHHNMKVSNQAWDQLYADRFDELAHRCELKGDMMEARRNRIYAHKLRTERNEDVFAIDGIQPVKMMISPNITAERLGLEEFNLKEMWKDTKIMISKFDINSKEKNKVIREAALGLGMDTVDADFVNIDDDDK